MQSSKCSEFGLAPSPLHVFQNRLSEFLQCRLDGETLRITRRIELRNQSLCFCTVRIRALRRRIAFPSVGDAVDAAAAAFGALAVGPVGNEHGAVAIDD